MTTKQTPAHTLRLGCVKAAIWANSTQNGTRYNVTVSRLYKDGDTWKESHSFGHDDLPVLALACQEAYFWIRGHNTA